MVNTTCRPSPIEPVGVQKQDKPLTADFRSDKTATGVLIEDRHQRAAKALGYALTLASPKHWDSTAIIWEARLELAERYELARSVMLAMCPETIEALFEDVMGGAGYPLPPLLDPLEDAKWWADLANPSERRAYCLAAFMSMSKREQRDFLDFAKGAVA